MIDWISLPLSDLPIATGNSINPFDFPDEEFELYSVPSHETGKPELVKGRDIGSNKQLVSPGTVLLCKINPRINRTWIVSEAGSRRQIASTEWISFYGCEEVDPRFLMFFMQQSDVRDYLAANASGVGGSLMRVKPATLKGVNFRIPGIRTQRKIVEKLEELLSDLDAGVAELKAAQRKLAQYRQSLLKAAVEGALTADWRATKSTSSRRKPGSSCSRDDQPQKRDPGLRRDDEEKETGAELLQRILSERRTRWEQKQLARFAEQGKAPLKGWRDKYPEPLIRIPKGLPSLPEGWAWASLDQLTEFVTSGSRGWADHYTEKGATFIRSQNINRDFLDLSDIAFVNPPRTSEGTRTRVQRSDLLLTITGANVGKAAVVDVELEEAYVSQHVALMRPVDSGLSEYLHLFLTCKAGGRGQLNKMAYGAGKPGLNLQQVQSVTVPVPNTHELPRLLRVLGASLDATSAQTDSIACGLRQAAAQRKNILKAAFSGQLVPQDPNDEPASALLARIRAQREANAGTPARKRGRKAKGAT